MSETLDQKLAVEEFKQMHELIRQREGAMNQTLSLIITAFSGILAVMSAFVFKDHDKESIIYCYLFLCVQPFLVFGLAVLTSHRDDQYRMGLFLMVFYEELRGDGPKWHVHLARFRQLEAGESQDSVTLIVWSLYSISSALYVASLHYHNYYILMNSVLLIPTAIWIRYQNGRFLRDRSYIADLWRKLRDTPEKR